MDAEIAALEQATEPYIGRWNQLVSTTNWEKGRIIGQWRAALAESGTSAAQYSDDAWARRVGGVTGQHVGRLRRVHERFGEAYEEYAGLYWSHFHAALDWDDAEMWLEGAIQNQWSVSQMRRQRWETLGELEENRPRDEDVITAELDEDFEPAENELPTVISGTVEDVQSTPRPDGPDFGDDDMPRADRAQSTRNKDEEGASIYADEHEPAVPFVRPFDNISELPDDITDAFEAFKLAILRHKGDGWREIARDDLLSALDALKELANAPSGEDAPF